MTGLATATLSDLPIGLGYPWLAPLAGFSDLPFRLLCRELGAAVACTEMISAKGLVLGQGAKSGATAELLATYPPRNSVTEGYMASVERALLGTAPVSDSPLVVQLFGSEVEYMAEAVHILVKLGYEWFDCNMGCSVPKVRKSGSGSALLNTPDTALAVGRAMLRVAGRGKVGFKMRLGQDAGNETYLSLGKQLAESGAGWLTLHPRYAKQKFTGFADWKALKPLVESVQIPVMVSGDLFTPEDGLAALAASGASGVMFARGAMSNPAIFSQFITLAKGKVTATGALLNERMCGAVVEDIIRRHIALTRALSPTHRNRQGIESGLLKMRTFIPRYVKDFSGARALRRAISSCTTWEVLEQLLDDFFVQNTSLPLQERLLL